ncbi:hypothetical protein, partial [Microbacterium sp. ZXX196]|uniref:hypothetical protein n=1 Tax=Microbacterium sp. ZXX196 TaxID=2609291 RepID=UPI0012B811C1
MAEPKPAPRPRDGERSVLRPFVRTARAGGWRALAVSGATSATVTVAAADAVLVAGEPWAVAVLPALVVVAAIPPGPTSRTRRSARPPATWAG